MFSYKAHAILAYGQELLPMSLSSVITNSIAIRCRL
jgi:hypothetical protein